MLAFCQLALSMSLVGANVVIGKLLAQSLPVPVILLIRCAIGSLMLAPLLRRHEVRLPRLRDLTVSGGQALLGTLGYNSFLLAGLRLTGALQAGLLLATLPAVIATGAALLLGERLTVRRWAGAALAVFGMAALAASRGGAGAQSWTGDALVVLAVISEAGYVLLARILAVRQPPIVATFWLQISGVVLMAPFGLPLIAQSAAALQRPAILALVLLNAATASVLCNLLWFSGLRRVPASLAAVFGVFLPGTAALMAVLVLGERLTAGLAAGFALMLASIILATWPSRDVPRPARLPADVRNQPGRRSFPVA